MLREIKTTLLGDSSRTDSGLPTEHGDSDEADVVLDARGVDDTDPLRRAPDVGGDSDGDELSMDRLFNTLGDERRRYALTYLSMRPQGVTTTDLVERVAVWECEKHPEDLTSRERERVHVSMTHCHLPKLDSTSAISYNEERGTIERGDQFERFTCYLHREE
jgi:hypothetical protein